MGIIVNIVFWLAWSAPVWIPMVCIALVIRWIYRGEKRKWERTYGGNYTFRDFLKGKGR